MGLGVGSSPRPTAAHHTHLMPLPQRTSDHAPARAIAAPITASVAPTRANARAANRPAVDQSQCIAARYRTSARTPPRTTTAHNTVNPLPTRASIEAKARPVVDHARCTTARYRTSTALHTRPTHAP